MTWMIETDGFFFRAVNGSFRTTMFSSPSQAGLYIFRKAGKEAYEAAVDAFIKSKEKK